jgi:5-formyltetrahydrofolate cyclo-ligase
MDSHSTPPSLPEIALAKRRLREEARRRLIDMDPADAAARSARICDRILHAPFYYAARVIMAFDPLVPAAAGTGVAREVDVRPVLRRSLELGKRLCIPRMNWETGEMVPVAVADLERDLVPAAPPGRQSPAEGGLREPRPDLPAVPLDALDAILVPGLAFDHAGRRLGRGKGFYDRFLAQDVLIRGGAPTCGVAFSLSIVPEIPHTWTDVPVDAVVTEDGVHGAEA